MSLFCPFSQSIVTICFCLEGLYSQRRNEGIDSYLQCEFGLPRMWIWASQVLLMVKNLLASAGGARDSGLISGSGRSPGEGNGNPLQYSCLKHPMDRGAWSLAAFLQHFHSASASLVVTYQEPLPQPAPWCCRRVRHDWETEQCELGLLLISDRTCLPLT